MHRNHEVDMNYYKRHLGDYAAATRHLSILEHGVYTLLLDTYYIGEKPLPTEVKTVCRLVMARSKDEREAVAQVLEEFFDLQEDGWHQVRCDEELAARQEKAEKNREIGKRGGRPKKTITVSETETQTVISDNPNGFKNKTIPGSENNPSHKPLAISQEPRTKGAKAAATTPPTVSRADEGSPPPAEPPADPLQARVVEIAVLLRRRGAALQTGDPRLRRWAETGVTDAQLLTALETAQQRREDQRNAQPVNAGYLDSILADGAEQSRDSPGRRKTRAEIEHQRFLEMTREQPGDGQVIDMEAS
jgi:uncharacterized protein YdaU (DUF1376 family)